MQATKTFTSAMLGLFTPIRDSVQDSRMTGELPGMLQVMQTKTQQILSVYLS